MAYFASCHCGGFELQVPSLPDQATACNCSWCSRIGGLWGYYAPDAVVILKAIADRVYDPNEMNRHHFCGTCSCLMYNDTPKWDPETSQPTGERQISVNLRMIDDDDAAQLPVVEVDGRDGW